ncbi:hypothetical protein [Nonomuraea sp. NPDC049646]|uniref:hypothetical protein n=1 Tax=unclassified Nonomuraea TaxID=2593643 RepID=UPI00379F7D35
MVCGDDGGDPPTINDVVDAYHNDYGDPPGKLIILAIRHLCPKYIPLLAKGKNGFTDGAYTVGDGIKPGTYRTHERIEDCYWARSTGGGDIISNAFVQNAPRGVKVTVYKGEGFTSEGCGYWWPA